MAQIDKDRFHNMARCYDKMADYLVPQYHFLQDQVIAMLITNVQPNVVVDLGAGSGLFLEKVLETWPQSKVVWVDYSDDFRQVAMERLAPFADRVQYAVASFTDDWTAMLPAVPDAIYSSNAIHHLEHDAKRELYARCFNALSPGGWFYNVDEMSTLYDDAYRRTLDYWIAHVDKAVAGVSDELQSYAQSWCEKFESWKKRNVENLGQPKQPGDDIHECFVDQLRWLHEIGFVNADLFVKFHLWSVIGGQKPEL